MRAPTTFGTDGKAHRTRVLTRTACGKNGYTTKKLAKQVAAMQRKDSGEPIFAYRCPHGCHVWHIGHPPGWRRNRERVA